MDAALSPNVKFLIQTGGSERWRNERVPNDTIGRYVYDSDGWHYQGAFVDADMGDSKTLADFIRYGKEVIEPEFKPDHRMFIFWNHGGFVGVCYDSRYKNKKHPELEPSSFIDIDELHQVFNECFPHASASNPPFEIIGLDVCFGATYENFNNLYGFTKYVVASENEESAYGWYYTDWIKSLAANPSISGKSLGKIICDTSYDYLKSGGYKEQGDYRENGNNEFIREYAKGATFAVIDFSNWLDFRKSYESFGNSILKLSQKNPDFYGTLEDASKKWNYVDGMVHLVDLNTFSQEIKNAFLDDSNERHVSDWVSSSDKNRILNSIDRLSKSMDSVVCYDEARAKEQIDSHGMAVYYPVGSFGKEQEKAFALYDAQTTAPNFIKKLSKGRIDAWKSEGKSARKDDDLDRYKPDKSQIESGTKSRSRSRSNEDESTAISNESNINPVSFLINDGMSYSDLENISGKEYDPSEFEISLQLTPDQTRILSQAGCFLAAEGETVEDFVDLGQFQDTSEAAVFLGNIMLSKKNGADGKYIINPKNRWLAINGNIVCAFFNGEYADKLDSDGNVIKWGHTNYTVPVYLNGNSEVPYNLEISYSHENKKYTIESVDERNQEIRGRASARKINRLGRGDRITPLFAAGDSTTGELVQGTKSFILSSSLNIEDVLLPSGYYAYVFYTVDIYNKPVVLTDVVVMFEVNSDGKIENLKYASPDIEDTYDKELNDDDRQIDLDELNLKRALEYDKRIQAEKERRMNLEQERFSKKRNRSK